MRQAAQPDSPSKAICRLASGSGGRTARSPTSCGRVLVALGLAVTLFEWCVPVQTTDAEMGQTQGARPIGDSVTATLKKETVIPVLSVLRDYAKTRRPDLTRLLDSVELVVPGGSDPNAAAFHWGHSNIVTVNLPLLLDFTELAELVAVSSTAHPAAEAVYSRTLGTYEAYLKALHPGSMGGEAWIIYRSLRR